LFSSIYMHTGHTRRLTQKATAVEGVNTDRRHTYKAHVQGTHTRHIEDTFRHHTPSDTKHLGLPWAAAGAMEKT
jgi:hypothetical protein